MAPVIEEHWDAQQGNACSERQAGSLYWCNREQTVAYPLKGIAGRFAFLDNDIWAQPLDSGRPRNAITRHSDAKLYRELTQQAASGNQRIICRGATGR